jgi:DNA-binding MarR family transcriptional regulator
MSDSNTEMTKNEADDMSHDREPLPAFDLNLSPSHLLYRAQQVAADLHSAAFGASGLTPRQLAVLVVLGSGDGISQTELVAKTGIDRSTLAEMVARMEVKGLMARAKSTTDSRANAVHLTQTGRDALAAALPTLASIDKSLLSLISTSKRDSFMELLTQIVIPRPAKTKVKADQEGKKAKKKEKKKKDKKKKRVKLDVLSAL